MSVSASQDQSVSGVGLLARHYRSGESAGHTTVSSQGAGRRGWQGLGTVARVGAVLSLVAGGIGGLAYGAISTVLAPTPSTAPKEFASLDGYTKATNWYSDFANIARGNEFVGDFRDFEKTVPALAPAVQAAKHQKGTAAERLDGWDTMIAVAKGIANPAYKGAAITYWVNENITYSQTRAKQDNIVKGNKIQSPVQTLTTGTGICRDTAALIVTGMIEAGVPKRNVGLLALHVQELSGQSSGHAVAVLNMGRGNVIYGNAPKEADAHGLRIFFSPTYDKATLKAAQMTPTGIYGFGWSQTYADTATQTALVPKQEAGYLPTNVARSDIVKFDQVVTMAASLRARTDRETAPAPTRSRSSIPAS